VKLKENITRLVDKLVQWFSTRKLEQSKTRSTLLFLFFVFISALLWCFLTFNNAITLDMAVPVKVVGKPDNVRFLSNVPDTITVTVTDKGSSFFKYIFRSTPTLELKFNAYANGENLFKVDASQLKRLIQRNLNRGTTISAVLPENISVKYTDGPGKKVPVVLDMDMKPQLMFVQYGPITLSSDSVVVFADPATLSKITEVYTYHFKAMDLTDTLRRRVSIAQPKGAVVEPRNVNVTVPVERMVNQWQKLHIAVRNVPNGVKVILFPSSVEVSYRAPVSVQKRTTNDLTAVVDYNAISESNTNKVAVQIGERPVVYQDVKLSVDSVEYIIEK